MVGATLKSEQHSRNNIHSREIRDLSSGRRTEMRERGAGRQVCLDLFRTELPASSFEMPDENKRLKDLFDYKPSL